MAALTESRPIMNTSTTLASLLACATLAACALSPVAKAPPGTVSGEQLTVVAGRVNYVIDGEMKAPYGPFRPAWQAPPMTAMNLATGNILSFAAVDGADGSFRWQLPPGAYAIAGIGAGAYADEQRITWPRVVICVPRAPGSTVYVGHLQLEGRRYSEEVVLSTGTRYTARGVRYGYRVVDEGHAVSSGPVLRRLMRHVPDMPIGESLENRRQSDADGLVRQLCGGALS